MNEKPKPPENCLKNGCYWPSNCSRCGFNKAEAERRKKLPLVLWSDGLRRKIIPRKERPEDEQEETTNE